MEEAKLVRYILERKEIVLPTILLKQKAIPELERALRTARPLPVSQFFKKIYNNFDEYIDVKGLDKLFNLIGEVSKLENFQHEVSEDDERIINFLVNETKLKNTEILELLGQQYFLIQVVGELEKSADKLLDILKITLFMWCFVNTYELVLHEVDRRLLSHLKKQKNKDPLFNEFINKVKREEYKDHATAGLINKVLCKLLHLQEDNNSIFGKSSKPKLMRNKISHSNMFYDSEKNKLVLLDGQEFTIDDFLNEYYRIFNFLFCWINKGLDNEFNKERIISDMKKSFKALSSKYLQIERGSLSKIYSSYIIKLKKEVGVKNASTTN